MAKDEHKQVESDNSGDDAVTTGNQSDESLETASRPKSIVLDRIKAALATRNGRIVAGVLGAALLVSFLFASHIICFHDWREATCTLPELCRKCGKPRGEALGHEWKAATCTTPKTCDRCGETEGVALGHEVDEWRTTVEATCTSEGEEQGACVRCGEVQKRTADKKAHEFGEWETTVAATCTEKGTRTRKCNACGKQETQDVAMIDHTAGEWEVIDPTPDDRESFLYIKRVQKCTKCGKVLDEEREQATLTVEAFDYIREGDVVCVKAMLDPVFSIRDDTDVKGYSEDEDGFSYDFGDPAIEIALKQEDANGKSWTVTAKSVPGDYGQLIEDYPDMNIGPADVRKERSGNTIDYMLTIRGRVSKVNNDSDSYASIRLVSASLVSIDPA